MFTYNEALEWIVRLLITKGIFFVRRMTKIFFRRRFVDDSSMISYYSCHWSWYRNEVVSNLQKKLLIGKTTLAYLLNRKLQMFSSFLVFKISGLQFIWSTDTNQTLGQGMLCMAERQINVLISACEKKPNKKQNSKIIDRFCATLRWKSTAAAIFHFAWTIFWQLMLCRF